MYFSIYKNSFINLKVFGLIDPIAFFIAWPTCEKWQKLCHQLAHAFLYILPVCTVDFIL